MAKEFDYVVPDEWVDRVSVGTRVRVQLGGRRVGGWIVALRARSAVEDLRPLAKLSGLGPSPELIELAGWARWRWASRTAVPFLRTASPPRIVDHLPAVSPTSRPSDGARGTPPPTPAVARAFELPSATLRLGPAEDRFPVIAAATARGDALVLCPTWTDVHRLLRRLDREGIRAVAHPDDWGRAAAGGRTVVGARAAAWSRMPELAAIVVVDEHDEAHQEERSPTWHARDLALERARRAGVPCVLTSPTPSAEASAVTEVVTDDRASERAAWPAAVVVDRREDDAARNALFSPALARLVTDGARIVCVLNRKGRAALLACATCHELARCDDCDGALRRQDVQLECRRCGRSRPVVCASCGGLHLKTVRLGVSRVAEDLAALAGEPVAEVTADAESAPADPGRDGPRLVVGTEAVLHRVRRADVVAFLDVDQELLAPRFAASAQALTLVARAGRIVGGRSTGGRVLLQTRLPDHEVCRAAVAGDPTIVADADRDRRRMMGLPPFGALAELGDEAADEFATRLRSDDRVEVLGPLDGRYRVRAADHDALCDALAAVERPPGRLRLAVDPPRL